MRRESHVRFCERLAVRLRRATLLVILSRGHADEALAWTRRVMTRLGLTLNEAKTTVRDARQERFDFLGYSFGPHHYRKDGHWYLGASPSRKSVQRIKGRVGEILVHRHKDRALGSGARPIEPAVAWLGGVLRLWHAIDGLSGGGQSCL